MYILPRAYTKNIIHCILATTHKKEKKGLEHKKTKFTEKTDELFQKRPVWCINALGSADNYEQKTQHGTEPHYSKRTTTDKQLDV